MNSAVIFPFYFLFGMLPCTMTVSFVFKSPVRIISPCCFILIVVSLASSSLVSSMNCPFKFCPAHIYLEWVAVELGFWEGCFMTVACLGSSYEACHFSCCSVYIGVHHSSIFGCCHSFHLSPASSVYIFILESDWIVVYRWRIWLCLGWSWSCVSWCLLVGVQSGAMLLILGYVRWWLVQWFVLLSPLNGIHTILESFPNVPFCCVWFLESWFVG